MKFRFYIYSIFCCIFFSVLIADNNFKSYEEPYQDVILYLHPLLNYSPPVDWQYDQDKNIFAMNGLYISTGSVTTDDLLLEARLVINQDLGKGWWFRGWGIHYDTRHLNLYNNSLFMGFDKHVFKNTYLFLQVNPHYDKEYTDIMTGVALYSIDSEQYLRLGLLMEDFIYDEKNDFNAISDQTPLALRWQFRYILGAFILYTDGKFSRGFKRKYPDQRKSPDIFSHSQHTDHNISKLYYKHGEKFIIEISYSSYRFEEGKTFIDSLFNYIYGNNLNDFGCEGNFIFLPENHFRFNLHYLAQKAHASMYRAHRYARRDYLSGVFYERDVRQSRIDFGYMISFYDYRYHGLAGQKGYTRQGYVDKLKLGWTYRFPQGARLHLSLSHELSSGEFGGANLQSMIFF